MNEVTKQEIQESLDLFKALSKVIVQRNTSTPNIAIVAFTSNIQCILESSLSNKDLESARSVIDKMKSIILDNLSDRGWR